MDTTTEFVFGGFLFGVFTAYWAQTTRRNPWLWLFFGWFLPPVAGVLLLLKNSARPAPRNLDARGRDDLIAVRKDIP